jgi:hypothetical protein
MTSRATLVLAVGLSAWLAGVALSRGYPRLTLTNEGLVVAHAWRFGGWALFAAAGCGVAIAAARQRRWLAVLLVAVAAGTAARAAELLSRRVEIDREGVASLGALSAERVAWGEVTRIERGPARLVVWGRDDARIQIETGAMSSDQRAVLERAIARRVIERAPAGGVR